MNEVIVSESTIKIIFEQIESSVEPFVSKLFRILNEEKKKYKTRKELLEAIKSICPYMGIPEGYELYLLELYLLNYREDGNYRNLSKENFVDPRKQRGKTTSNPKSNLYTIAKLPFKGSNLRGYWTKDDKGVPYYLVQSYGWYPIYIFKEGKWYQITDSYSSSTARQLSNANPSRYSEELNTKVYLATRTEMQDLERNATFEDIKANKIEQLKQQEKKLTSKKLGGVTAQSPENPYPVVKIKYKIKSIDTSVEPSKVTVDIYDVLKTKGRTGLPTPENYLKGELRGVTKEFIEEKLKNKLNRELRDYIGPSHWWFEHPEDANFVYVFNHLKK